MADFEAIKQQQQRTWALGDFSVIGWNTVYPGELLCEAVNLRAGETVLDVATGSGNTALSAARRNCDATGIDYVPALIERARQRASWRICRPNLKWPTASRFRSPMEVSTSC